MKNKIQDEIIKELWEIRNPRMDPKDNLLKEEKEKIRITKKSEKKPKTKIPLPSHKGFFELVTARNRWLINPHEQNILRKNVGAFFGLSVGSYAATTWAMLSRCDVIKISDPDTLAPTNLNRMQQNWDDLGSYKVDLVLRKIKDLNPYCEVLKFKKTDNNTLEEIFTQNPRPNFVIDEIDDFKSKISLRKYASRLNIPLISAADVGDMVIVDVERYDTNPKPEPFLGRIKDPFSIKFDNLSEFQKKKLIIGLVGLEKNSEKMINSLFAIGQASPSWPQLGSTAVMAGGIVSNLIKKILLGEEIESGRYYISLDDIFVKDFSNKKLNKDRERKIHELNKVVNNE